MRQVLLLLFVTLLAICPAIAANKIAVATTAAAAPEAAVAGTSTNWANQSWKHKLAQRIVKSKVGRWTLKTLYRVAAPAEGSTNTISLVAGIMGILSVVFLLVALTTGALALLALIAGVAALVLGIVGLSEVNKRNEGGKGWALAGIIGGSVTLLIFLLAVLLLAAIFF
jgi:hypothetical protein